MRNFLFHRVNPVRDRLWDPMDPALFEKCIRYIANNYEVVNLESVLLAGVPSSRHTRMATILFDDGYKDNLTYAAPILQKYKCPASFYIVTGCIDNNIPTWTHILEYLFVNTNRPTIDFNKDMLPEDLRRTSWANKAERKAYVKRLKPVLKSLTHTQRKEILDEIIQQLVDVELPRIMLSWEDVKQLKDAGHSIGSHTVTHSMLGTMHDAQDVARELVESAHVIKKHLGTAPVTISYPVGSYNEGVMRASEACGYKIGLAVHQKLYDPSRDPIFAVPRIELYNESWLKTRLRIRHTLERIKSAIGYRRSAV